MTMDSQTPEIWQGVAPILGPGRSCFLSGAGHVKTPPLGSFGSRIGAGFYVGLDLHPSLDRLYIVCGAGSSRATRFVIRLDARVSPPVLSLEVADDQNRELAAQAELSNDAGKRLFVAAYPGESRVEVFEVNLLDSPPARRVEYIKKDALSDFGDLNHDFIIGGANLDGNRIGSFTGRVANVFIKDSPLQARQVEALVKASRAEIQSFNGALRPLQASEERLALFLDDLQRLKVLAQITPISNHDLRELSNILFRWLFDRHPLLQTVSTQYGVQMSMPGENARARAYHDMLVNDAPLIALPMHLGTESVFGFDWVAVREFGRGLALIVKGAPIRIEPLVKFVRNKLGGAHFDETDRKKWQRDLAAMSGYVRNDRNVMNHHVQQVAKAVLAAVAATQLEEAVAP